MSPEIDVVIPTTDRISGFLRCIESVNNQAYEGRLNLFVIENNSGDKCAIASILEGFSFGSNINVTHVYLISCKNANEARDYGASLGVSEYVSFLDSDDEWHKGHIKSSIQILSENFCGGCYSSYNVIRTRGVARPRISRQISKGEEPVNFLFNGGYAQTSSFVLRRQVFEKVKWDVSLKRNQDYDFFIKTQKQFGWVYSGRVTVNVYWEVGSFRSHDIGSYMEFLERYERSMNKKARNIYYLHMFLSYSRGRKEDFLAFKNRYFNSSNKSIVTCALAFNQTLTRRILSVKEFLN